MIYIYIYKYTILVSDVGYSLWAISKVDACYIYDMYPRLSYRLYQMVEPDYNTAKLLHE